MTNRGLPKLAGGIAKRKRKAWERPCRLPGCGRPAAGIIETLRGPQPICEARIPGAERLGYKVRRPTSGMAASNSGAVLPNTCSDRSEPMRARATSVPDQSPECRRRPNVPVSDLLHHFQTGPPFR
jgi:hypothetical protein